MLSAAWRQPNSLYHNIKPQSDTRKITCGAKDELRAVIRAVLKAGCSGAVPGYAILVMDL